MPGVADNIELHARVEETLPKSLEKGNSVMRQMLLDYENTFHFLSPVICCGYDALDLRRREQRVEGQRDDLAVNCISDW